mmetsp:Transcript_38879/g.61449  ORF Transcript_38879/g.61449 Transcript_38879/m.61449 type:complete len:153 (-) Transcript_38879:1121-1579(-)
MTASLVMRKRSMRFEAISIFLLAPRKVNMLGAWTIRESCRSIRESGRALISNTRKSKDVGHPMNTIDAPTRTTVVHNIVAWFSEDEPSRIGKPRAHMKDIPPRSPAFHTMVCSRKFNRREWVHLFNSQEKGYTCKALPTKQNNADQSIKDKE